RLRPVNNIRNVVRLCDVGIVLGALANLGLDSSFALGLGDFLSLLGPLLQILKPLAHRLRQVCLANVVGLVLVLLGQLIDPLAQSLKLLIPLRESRLHSLTNLLIDTL